jgi:uroporphyrinogen-III synthase
LIKFFPIPVGDFPPVDWIFFYSQTAARFFFKQFSPKKVEDIRLASIGGATSEVITLICRLPDFNGNGDPAESAENFLQVAKGQRVLFPQANNSRQSIQNMLGDQITGINLVVYDNQPRTDFELPFFDCLVFTSPMNAQAYCSKKSLQDRQKIIAIGNTTARALYNLGAARVIIADMASEESLAKAVLKS